MSAQIVEFTLAKLSELRPN